MTDAATLVRVRPTAGIDGWQNAGSAPRDGRLVEVFFPHGNGSYELRQWDGTLPAWTEPGNDAVPDGNFTLWRPSRRDIATYVSVPRPAR